MAVASRLALVIMSSCPGNLHASHLSKDHSNMTIQRMVMMGKCINKFGYLRLSFRRDLIRRLLPRSLAILSHNAVIVEKSIPPTK
ncbi:hypothetical protein BKA56DRAFT_595702 [Ilyonectria sp. MPI-CAGE-AT-0026]|nr:hypothetical protein BKA56DRAFT_595702 [Ilyonectria sp. MPI-CAGE-AT-0026]